MSEKPFVKRVAFVRSEGVGVFLPNFSTGFAKKDSIPDSLSELIEIFEEWTSFCISAIKFFPKFGQNSNSFTNTELQEEILAEFKRTSVSYEEDSEEVDGVIIESQSFIIHEEDVFSVKRRLNFLSHEMRTDNALQRAKLSSLIAEFDFLMLKVLKTFAIENQSIFVSDDEAIPAAYFRQGNSFKDWEKEKSEEEISKILRGSHEATIKWILEEIAEVENLKTVTSNKYYIDFLEICQRRHLFVHNGGVVNKNYITNCRKIGVNEDNIPAMGTRLHADAKYLRSAAARVYLTGTYLTHLCIQKRFPQHKEESYSLLLSASHDFLSEDLTKMAERIIDFAEYKKKDFKNDTKLSFGVNRALCKLFDQRLSLDEQTSSASEVLDQYDWSLAPPKFELAQACIRRDFSNIINLAKSAANTDLDYEVASYFCVFREAREIEGFMSCFAKKPLAIEDKSLDYDSA